MNKYLCLILIVAINCVAHADTWWWSADGGDVNFNNPANWLYNDTEVPTTAPSSTETLNIDDDVSLGGPVLDDAGAAAGIWVAPTTGGTLTIGSTGQLVVSGDMWLGGVAAAVDGSNDATVIMDGTLELGSLYIGQNAGSYGEFFANGSNLKVNNNLQIGNTDALEGYLEVNGTQVTAGALWMGNGTANAHMVINSGSVRTGTLVVGNNGATGQSLIDIYGGTLSSSSLWPQTSQSYINLAGGSYELRGGDTTGTLQSHIDNGKITGYATSPGVSNPRATFKFLYTSGVGTKVWAEIPDLAIPGVHLQQMNITSTV